MKVCSTWNFGGAWVYSMATNLHHDRSVLRKPSRRVDNNFFHKPSSTLRTSVELFCHIQCPSALSFLVWPLCNLLASCLTRMVEQLFHCIGPRFDPWTRTNIATVELYEKTIWVTFADCASLVDDNFFFPFTT